MYSNFIITEFWLYRPITRAASSGSITVSSEYSTMKIIRPKTRPIFVLCIFIFFLLAALRLSWLTYTNLQINKVPRIFRPKCENGIKKVGSDSEPCVETPVQRVKIGPNSRHDHSDAQGIPASKPVTPALSPGSLRSSLVSLNELSTHRKGAFLPSRRIVHLDLKGAPPKTTYFQGFFRLISQLGATGVLIEWEDMFPYTGDLAACKNGNAYLKDEVKSILGWAKEYGLEVIPLVQTFGHLEWVLKHGKYAHLREVFRYPQAICLTNMEAIDLVKMIIDQVLQVHDEYGGFNEYFHIGADEAFQVGVCNRCRNAIKDKTYPTVDILMLDHIKNIARYVRDSYKRKVLVWHDMLNNVQLPTLNASNIGQYVEPVVWAYAESVTEYVRPNVWNKFSQIFPFIWAASAFKGADGPNRFYSNPYHYMKNHITWSKAMNEQYMKFNEFRGLILTGWQRFDHFAVLCELLPVGIPSLALNLQIIRRGGQLTKQTLNETRHLLGCDTDLNVHSMGPIANGCQFPGALIYYKVQELKQVQDRARSIFEDHMTKGWIDQYNVRHNYTSVWYVDKIVQMVDSVLISYHAISKTLKTELEQVFHNETVQEFLLEYVDQDVEKLTVFHQHAERLRKHHSFPVQPLTILRRSVQKEAVTTPQVDTSTISDIGEL